MARLACHAKFLQSAPCVSVIALRLKRSAPRRLPAKVASLLVDGNRGTGNGESGDTVPKFRVHTIQRVALARWPDHCLQNVVVPGPFAALARSGLTRRTGFHCRFEKRRDER